MTQAPQLAVSRATRTASNWPNSALSTLSSLLSPHLIIGTRRWPAATLCPRRDGPSAEESGYKSHAHCWHLQVLGLDSSTKGVPPFSLLGLPRLRVTSNSFRTEPFPGALTPSLTSPEKWTLLYTSIPPTNGRISSNRDPFTPTHWCPRMSCDPKIQQ